MTLPGNIRDVPEFHDCQRFIVQDRPGHLRYDSIFAIFVPPGLAQLEEELLKFGFGEVALATAEIYANGQYRPLAIADSISCLFVWLTGQSAAPGYAYKAKMVPRRTVPHQDCRQRLDPKTLRGDSLQVVPTVADSFYSGADYPAVARWDWDTVNAEQYIGIRCGVAWCEVGRFGFKPSPTYLERLPNPSDLPRGLRRIYAIKGWYDEQFLAEVKKPGDPPVPTGILGTLFPDSLLGTNDPTHFDPRPTKPRGPRVAHVALQIPRGAANPYESKYGWNGTTPGDPLNTIDLCRGTAGACLPPDAVATAPACPGMWWATTQGTGTSPKHICVIRYHMPRVTIPATARWRWLASDEGDWIRCLEGCCEMTTPG